MRIAPQSWENTGKSSAARCYIFWRVLAAFLALQQVPPALSPLPEPGNPSTPLLAPIEEPSPWPGNLFRRSRRKLRANGASFKKPLEMLHVWRKTKILEASITCWISTWCSNLETSIDIPHIVWILCEELEPGQMRKMSFPVKSEISLLVIWRVTGIIQLVMSNQVL